MKWIFRTAVAIVAIVAAFIIFRTYYKLWEINYSPKPYKWNVMQDEEERRAKEVALIPFRNSVNQKMGRKIYYVIWHAHGDSLIEPAIPDSIWNDWDMEIIGVFEKPFVPGKTVIRRSTGLNESPNH